MIDLDDLLNDSDSSLLIESGVAELIVSKLHGKVSFQYFLVDSSGSMLEQSPGSSWPSDSIEFLQEENQPLRWIAKGKSTVDIIPVRLAEKLLGYLLLIYRNSADQLLLGPLLQSVVEAHMGKESLVLEKKAAETRLKQYRAEKKNLQKRYEEIALDNLKVRMDIERSNHQLQLNVQEKEQFFHSLFETSPVPQWILDLSRLRTWLLEQMEKYPNLNSHWTMHPMLVDAGMSLVEVSAVNASAVRTYACNDRGVAQKIGLKPFPPSAQQILLEHLATLLSQESCGYVEIELTNLKGHRVNLLASFGIHQPNWELVSLFCVDITDRVTIEENLLRAKQDAETANLAKSQFLAVMSHELRTPLNGVMGFTSLLRDTPLNSEQTGYLTFISDSAHHLHGIVTDILDFVRLEQNEFEPDIQTFRLRSLIDELINPIMTKVQQKNLRLSQKFDPTFPDVLASDATMIRKILWNLLSNAIKFTNSGGIEIVCETFTLPSGQAECSIAIRDTGIGISHEKIPSLFEPFFQLDSSSSRPYEGLGIGLCICQRLARLLGGSIMVDSELGEGSIFTLRLPINMGQQPQIPLVWPTVPLRVAIAEDHETNAAVLREMLSRFSFDCSWYHNGQEIVNAFEECPFDIILMDIYMPIMDGVDAARLVQRLAQAKRNRTYIIGVAPAHSTMDRQRWLEAGIQTVLTTPISSTALSRAMQDACRFHDLIPNGCDNS